MKQFFLHWLHSGPLQPTDIFLLGKPAFFWSRVAKAMQLIGVLTIVLDVVGIERVRRVRQLLRPCLSALVIGRPLIDCLKLMKHGGAFAVLWLREQEMTFLSFRRDVRYRWKHGKWKRPRMDVLVLPRVTITAFRPPRNVELIQRNVKRERRFVHRLRRRHRFTEAVAIACTLLWVLFVLSRGAGEHLPDAVRVVLTFATPLVILIIAPLIAGVLAMPFFVARLILHFAMLLPIWIITAPERIRHRINVAALVAILLGFTIDLLCS